MDELSFTHFPGTSMRWILGPVFRSECLRAGRRWQTYAVRSLIATTLLVIVMWVWGRYVAPAEVLTDEMVPRVGEPLFYGLVGAQLVVALLLAPAATAGAICLDRSRGTLVHLLLTDVSSAEIILGKLAARLTGVLSLLLLWLPVLALSMLLGGIDPEAVLGASLITVGVAVLGCSLALALSVWGRSMHEVLFVNYLIWLAALAVYPVCVEASARGAAMPLTWATHTNPFWLAFAPYAAPGPSRLGEQLLALAVCLVLSVLLVILAAARLWPVVLGELSSRGLPPRSSLSWQSLLPSGTRTIGANPVPWLATRRVRGSGRLLGRVWGLYLLLAISLSVVGSLTAERPAGFRVSIPGFVNSFQVMMGLLLVGILAVSRLADERSHNTLDLLRTTPLGPREIVGGYWWGAFRLAFPMAVLVALVSAMSASRGVGCVTTLFLVVLVLSYAAAVTSLGIALATWLGSPGQAVTLVVVANTLVVLAVGCLAGSLGATGEPPVGVIVFMGSPFFGPIALTGDMVREYGEGGACWGAALWSAAYLIAAWRLFTWAAGSLEATLGRASSSPE